MQRFRLMRIPVPAEMTYLRLGLPEYFFLGLLSSPFLSSLIFIYCFKFLSCGELAFTHNCTHFVKPAKFNDQFQKCFERFFPLVSKRSSVGSGMPVLSERLRLLRPLSSLRLRQFSAKIVAKRSGFLSKISKLYSIIYSAKV